MKTSYNFTREELYELVWSKPMTKASTDLGISDVGLKKICRRNDIPVPPRGYWAKLAAGRVVKQVALPEVEGGSNFKIHITSTRKSDLSEAVSRVEEAAGERERQPENKIEVRSGQEPVTKMGIWLKARLAKRRVDEKGLKVIRSPQSFPVEVREESIDRAVAIIDALARALDERGLPVVRGEETAVLQIDGETVSFGLYEVVKRKKHEYTEVERSKLAEFDHKTSMIGWDESNWERRWEYRRTIPDYDYHSEGKLFLEIDENTYSGMRCKWGDAKIQRVENLLNDFVAHLEPHAVLKRERREEHEQWERERAEAERRRQEQARLERLRTGRREFVDRYIQNLEEIERLQSLLKALNQTPKEAAKESSLEFAAMLVWCQGEIERLQCGLEPDRIESRIQKWHGSFLFDDEGSSWSRW